MADALPLVSVIIPYHNRAERVLRALRSVCEQSYQQLEILLVDDGSDVAAMPSFRAFRGDSRLHFFQQPRSGVSAARNRGIRESQGSFVAFLDSDDEWFPEKIERQLSFFRADPQAVLCHCEEQWLRNGRRVNPRDVHRKARGEAFEDCLPLCRISPSAVMVRRSLFEDVGVFDERMTVCEDYELWLRVAVRYPIGFLDQCLVRKYGGHADQLSRSEPAMDRFRVFALLQLMAQQALNSSQQEAVRTVALEKLRILRSGAEKRGNVRFMSLCEKLSTHVRDLEHSCQQSCCSISEQLLNSKLLL